MLYSGDSCLQIPSPALTHVCVVSSLLLCLLHGVVIVMVCFDLLVSRQTFRDGMDFYFGEKSHSARFVDFLEGVVPTKASPSRERKGKWVVIPCVFWSSVSCWCSFKCTQ